MGTSVANFAITTLSEGSSPRVWGQAYTDFDGEKYTRIIPTRMGTRSAPVPHTFLIKDHPHAYGDKMDWFRTQVTNKGSSPRVWGQVEHCERVSIILRIIPTRMGTRRFFVRLG